MDNFGFPSRGELFPGGIAPDTPWSAVPTELLLTELSRRQQGEPTKPECGSKERGSYDTVLHVAALILVLALSTLSCGFPLISRQTSKGSRRQRQIIFLSQHFGTGVLLSTAFVHLLPTAFTSLTDPCLPYTFSKGYRPMAGLVAMVAALAVVAVESYLSTKGAGHSHSHGHELWEDDNSDDGQGADNLVGSSSLAERRLGSYRPADISLGEMETEGLVAGVSPLPDSTSPSSTPIVPAENPQTAGNVEDSDAESDLELNIEDLDPTSSARNSSSQNRLLTKARGADGRSKEDPLTAGPHIPTSEEQQRLLLQVVLLEAGILFHSIFIGMALSVATGPTFLVFLTAISFHQSFEGLALGSRIAAIQFPRVSLRPWLMVLAFGLTTPIGQAIGLIVHNLYDPRSAAGLLVVGFMNAISSGLLLFAGLVQLLAEDFLTEKSYKVLKGRRRLQAYLSVLAGAALMAGVGALA